MTTPPQATTESGGRRALLLSLAALAMAMLLSMVGLVFALFALVVSVRTTLMLRRAKSPLTAAVAGIVISLGSLLLAAAGTAMELYFGNELATYYECKKGAGTISAEQQCVDRLERAMEAKLPFMRPGDLQLPFAP